MHRVISLFSIIALASLGIASASSPYKVFASFDLTSKGADGQWKPVVGVREYKPLIVDGDRFVIGEEYWIRCESIHTVNDMSFELISVESKREGKFIILDVVLKGSRALPEPFAILTYNPEGGNWTACKYARMDALTGKQQTMRLRFNGDKVPEGGWSFHIFSGGLELYEKNRSDLVDATPSQAFELELSRYIGAVGSGNANPEPFYMLLEPPAAKLLPKGDDRVVVRVKMTIGKDGRLRSPVFQDKINDQLSDHITKNIDTWRFFPRIREGKLVEQSVVLPLTLR
jgi:hypothetical protein